MSGKYKVVIYGASGHARAIAAFLRRGFLPELACEVVAYIDDYIGGHGAHLGTVPILSFEQWRCEYASVPCIMIMGSPAAKAKIHSKIVAAAGEFADVYRHRPRDLFEDAEIGEGCFIGDYCVIGAQTTVGRHVQIMPLCSIGHDVEIGDYCTICPSSTISGYVVVEEGVYIGAGTTVVNGRPDAPLRIGRGAKIWAGSVVMRSVGANQTMAGNPASSLREFVRQRRDLVDV